MKRLLSESALPLAYALLFVVLSATIENFFLNGQPDRPAAVGRADRHGRLHHDALPGLTGLRPVRGLDHCFAGVLGAMVLDRTGSAWLAVVAALAAGTAIGTTNGLLIAQARINALIATLATMLMVRGAAFIASQGQAVGITDEGFMGLR